ncbi:MAG: ABC transporter ATP-binding protein, partial [Candidatus Thioglobus sp.]
MNQSQSIFQLLPNLWCHINLRRRRQFTLLLFLIVFASFVEIISIGAVIPFLGILTAPDKVFDHAAAQPFIHMLGITESGQLLLPLTIAFGVAAITAGVVRLLMLW